MLTFDIKHERWRVGPPIDALLAAAESDASALSRLPLGCRAPI